MPYDHNTTKTDARELKAAILEVLQNYHVGSRYPIKAGDIARGLGRVGRYSDRPIRAAIRQLRKEGHLILSSVRPPRGYFIAATQEEWEAFRDQNLRPRALDILETSHAMGQAAQVRWGGQLALELPELEPSLPWISDLVA